MRAIRIHQYGGPEQLQLEEVPMPVPGPEELLIRVAAAAVNPIDWKLRQGLFLQKPLPYTPGQDVSGYVESVGSHAQGFITGDAVFGMLPIPGDGSYADYVAAPASAFAHAPTTLPLIQAAALPMGTLTAWMALFDRGDLRPAQRVLIHGGAGAVGGMAVQLAKSRGAWVAATASGPGIATAREFGAEEVIDYKSGSFDALSAKVDLVIDTIGGDTRDRSWALLKDGGALVSTVGPAQPPAEVASRGVRGLPPVSALPDPARLAEVAVMVDSGRLQLRIGATFELPAAAQAQELNQHGHPNGKVLIHIGSH
jgi:NADPH:quinone reductase-like Zn-dependent oxidoreductase